MNRGLKEVINFTATVLLYVLTAGILWWYIEPGFLYNYDAAEHEVMYWITSYRVYGVLLTAILSTVLALVWRIIYSPMHKNSQSHYKSVLTAFIVFALLQLLIIASTIIFVRGYDGEAIYLPLLFMLPFLASTIYIAPITYRKNLFGFLNNTVGSIIFSLLYVVVHGLVIFF